MERERALFKHDMKEHQRKSEFEADLKRKLEQKLSDLQQKLDTDVEIREESNKLQRKIQSTEKEVRVELFFKDGKTRILNLHQRYWCSVTLSAY